MTSVSPPLALPFEAESDEREAFEKWARNAFVCSDHSFARAYSIGYFNTVQSQTFGGRVQPNYADVQMLWSAWQARAALSNADPSGQQTDAAGIAESKARNDKCPKRNPMLTDEQIKEIADATKSAEPGRDGYILPFTFARAIERAVSAPGVRQEPEQSAEIARLRRAIQQTLDENGHLADGEHCTLIHLVRALAPNGAEGTEAIRSRMLTEGVSDAAMSAEEAHKAFAHAGANGNQQGLASEENQSGYVLVPREPSEAMKQAGSNCAEYCCDDVYPDDAATIYRAMLAAAPAATYALAGSAVPPGVKENGNA